MNQEPRGDRDPSEDLAEWLRDSGHRRRPVREAADANAADNSAEQTCRVPSVSRLNSIFLAALLTVAYLQYYFLDTLLEIESMRSIIVFL